MVNEAAAAQTRTATDLPIALASTRTSASNAPLKCSFCGKSRDEVEFLFTGPASTGVGICDQCVALCNTMRDEMIEGKKGSASA